MRYFLVDHIIELEPGERIKGIKNVAMSEDFFVFLFPKNPIMPGILLLEALTQLAGWLEAASSDFKNWFLIDKVKKCSFYGFALPGDQVELELRSIPESETGKRLYKGMGKVGGSKKVTVEFEGIIVPLSDIEDVDEQKRFFQLLRREVNL